MCLSKNIPYLAPDILRATSLEGQAPEHKASTACLQPNFKDSLGKGGLTAVETNMGCSYMVFYRQLRLALSALQAGWM